jgi:hypothetical protein
MQGAAVVERNGDRRRRVVSFRYPERRNGFDRRAPEGRISALRHRLIKTYAQRMSLIAVVIGSIVTLNTLDFFLTLRALDLGARELNPAMAWMLENNVVLTGILKIGLGIEIGFLVWRLRRYRLVLEGSLLVLAVMFALTLYHVASWSMITG